MAGRIQFGSRGGNSVINPDFCFAHDLDEALRELARRQRAKARPYSKPRKPWKPGDPIPKH